MIGRELTSASRPQAFSSLANWESDIEDVMVEACEKSEDPSGYRVTFYKSDKTVFNEDERSYSIGASFLKNRMEKLSRAGFDAPMTKKALNIIDKERLKRVPLS